MNNRNKRAAIIAVGILPVSQAVSVHRPGSASVKLTGSPVAYVPSSAEFKEVITLGGIVTQQLSATLTDISSVSALSLRLAAAEPSIVVLTFSNHESRAVGSDEFPVQLQLEEAGRPGSFKLSFKRESPEPAKFIVLE